MLTLSQFIDRYKSTILPLKKASTQASFKGHFNLFKQSFGDRLLNKLSYEEVQRFVSEQAKTKAPKTVRNIYGTLHTLLVQAQREGLLKKIPSPVLPKPTKPNQPWFTLEQMRDIIRNSDGQEKVLFALLAETGMRIGEALALFVEDVDFEKRTISISKNLYSGKVDTPKTISSNRVIAISRPLRDMLKAHCGGRTTGWLFQSGNGSHVWANQALTKLLHPTLRSLGISEGGFHALRRGCITLCASTLAVPELILAQRVGHKPLGITLGVYGKYVSDSDREWADKIADALELPK